MRCGNIHVNRSLHPAPDSRQVSLGSFHPVVPASFLFARFPLLSNDFSLGATALIIRTMQQSQDENRRARMR